MLLLGPVELTSVIVGVGRVRLELRVRVPATPRSLESCVEPPTVRPVPIVALPVTLSVVSTDSFLA